MAVAVCGLGLDLFLSLAAAAADVAGVVGVMGEGSWMLLVLDLVLPSILIPFSGGSLGGGNSSMGYCGLGDGGGCLGGAGAMVLSGCIRAVGWQSFIHLDRLCFLGRLMDFRFRFPRRLWFVTGGGARGGGSRAWKGLGVGKRTCGGGGAGSSPNGGGGVGGGSGDGSGGGRVSSSGADGSVLKSSSSSSWE